MSKQSIARINVKRLRSLVLLLGLLISGMGVVRSSAGAPPSPSAEQPTKEPRRDRHGDPLPAGAVRRLGPQFAVRPHAFQELEKLGEDVRSELQKSLKGKPSLEVRKRLEDLLSRSKRLHAGSALRDMRAVEVLERLDGTELLTKLTKGAPEARMTREARAALDRLARRVKP